MLKILVTTLYLIESASLEKSGQRIHHGEDVAEGEYSFVVILCVISVWSAKPVQRICTASMVAEQWALTAAHCVTGSLAPPQDTIHVWYGNYTTSPIKTKQFSKVYKFIAHPGFRLNMKPELIVDNDISLLQVFRVKVKSYPKVLPVDYSSLTGLPVTYLGFGSTQDRKLDLYRRLQAGEGVIKACDQFYRRKSNHLICIASKCSKRNQTAYNGDSGGPLMYNGSIIGVASFITKSILVREQCFTPTSPYLDWIYITAKEKTIFVVRQQDHIT